MSSRQVVRARGGCSPLVSTCRRRLSRRVELLIFAASGPLARRIKPDPYRSARSGTSAIDRRLRKAQPRGVRRSARGRGAEAPKAATIIFAYSRFCSCPEGVEALSRHCPVTLAWNGEFVQKGNYASKFVHNSPPKLWLNKSSVNVRLMGVADTRRQISHRSQMIRTNERPSADFNDIRCRIHIYRVKRSILSGEKSTPNRQNSTPVDTRPFKTAQ